MDKEAGEFVFQDSPSTHTGFSPRRTRVPGRHFSWLLIIYLLLLLCWLWGRSLPLIWQAGLAGAWAVGLVGYTGLRRIRIFGPVCYYDLMRTGRQGRYVWLRSGYTIGLLLILYWVYVGWFRRPQGGLPDLFESPALEVRLLPQFGASFFYGFLWVQALAVLILTPIHVASALAEEKERGALEALLATHLEDQEIVLGKLASRLGQLLLLLLAGLPILAATQLLGGVDPELLLVSFAVTAVTMTSLASLSMLVSVYASRVANAVIGTFLVVAGFLFFSWLLSVLLMAIASVGQFLVRLYWKQDPAWWVRPDWSFGNPLLAYFHLDRALQGGMRPDAALVHVLGEYAFFQGILAVTCCYWAVRKLREVVLQPEAQRPLYRRPAIDFPPRQRRPPLCDREPLLWKETHADAPIGSWRFSALLMYLQIIFAWCLVGVMFLVLVLAPMSDSEFLYGSVVGLSNLLLIAMLLSVAFYAAGSFTRERERRTLDSLLSLPVERWAFLKAKWLGAMFAVRPFWWCVAVIWIIGLVTGTLHPLALPGLLAAWWVYAMFMSALGIWFSLRRQTSMQALVWTGTTLFILALFAKLVVPVALEVSVAWLPSQWVEPIVRLVQIGLLPWNALTSLSFSYDNLMDRTGPASWENLLAVLVGFLVYAVATAGLWQLDRRLLQRLT